MTERMSTWRKFDNFMQAWYTSMPEPWRSVVMGGIGITVAAIIIGVIVFMRPV